MPANSPVRAELWGDMAALCRALGRDSDAMRFAERALAVLQTQATGHEAALGAAYGVKGEVAEALGHKDEARMQFSQALDWARRARSPDASGIAGFERQLAALPR